MTKPVINIADVKFLPRDAAFPLTATGDAPNIYEAEIARVSPRIGAQQLGYNVTSVPPGKCALPAHSHVVNEEMFFILHGIGEVRIGTQTHALRPGDFVACPAGGTEGAHQIANTGTEELRYLAVSTMRSPEVYQYPNSSKFGLAATLPPTKEGAPRSLVFFGSEGQSAGYWAGE